VSGGNQQKASIAREIDSHPSLFNCSATTRDLDVGAIEVYFISVLIETTSILGKLSYYEF